jgi:surface protein
MCLVLEICIKCFHGCTAFNQPLNNWNVSNVTDMFGMFHGCTSFNRPLNNWNVSSVTDMSDMFRSCTAFNQPLNNWNVSNVRNYNNFSVRQEIRPNFNLQQQAQPQPQPQPLGIAYEIHNAFAQLEFTKFMQIIRKENNNAHNFMNPNNIFEHYIRYINGPDTKLIDKNLKTRILTAISPDGHIFVSLNVYLSEHPDYKKDVLEVLQFVLSQPVKYKDLYIESFENECMKAYSSTSSTSKTASCAKGVFERIFLTNRSTIEGLCFEEITGSTSAAASASAASASNTDCLPVYI